jgi:hypothetical protein
VKPFLLLALAACTGSGSGGPSESFVELENEGVACLHGSSAQSFVADQPVDVRVDWEGTCLSSSCTRESSASCAVSVTGSTVTIATSASWFDTSRSASACTADCGLLSATCETPSLAAGNYTFVLDGRSVEVTVPSTVQAAPCIR